MRNLIVKPFRPFRQFAGDEEGSLIIFSLYMLVLMLMIGGIAMDLARFESERKRFQNTADSAVLAATSLQSSDDGRAVAESFFEKSGYDVSRIDIEVNENATSTGGETVSRRVSVSGDLQMDTILMHMAGVPELNTVVRSGANESVQNVEISLVLDISGSMRYGEDGFDGTRIEKLREAVGDFVDIVLGVTCNAGGNNCVQSPESVSTTINVIPYAGHVNPGPTLFDMMGGNRWHDWSSCLEVSDDDFKNIDLPSESSHQLPHFMVWQIDAATMNWGWCPKDDAAILVAENDAKVIKDFVNNIRLHDGTATHVGMKYGAALLNPSSRDEFQALSLAGEIDPLYANRPADFESNVVKYVILMTDGQTTDQFRPKDVDYDILYDGDTLESLAEILGSFEEGNSGPGNNNSSARKAILDLYGSVDSEGNPNPAVVVEQGYPNNDVYRENNVGHTRGQNVANLRHVCNEAKRNVHMPDGTLKNDAITVFTVAFMAPNAVKADMRHCASTPAHYNEADTFELSTVFSSIARTITQLRLTQ